MVYGYSSRVSSLPSTLKVTFLKKEKGIPLLSIPLNSSCFFGLILKLMNLFKITSFTFNSILAAKRFITSQHNPLILMKANLSRGVDCKLTMTSLPFLLSLFGIFEAGVTIRELPRTRHRSAFSAYSKDLFNSYSGRLSPKLMIESSRGPKHFQHFLDVSCSYIFQISLVLKSLRN